MSENHNHYPDPRVFVCQGSPVCALEGEEAMIAQQARAAGLPDGCRWCKVITVHPDGKETVEEPGRA